MLTSTRGFSMVELLVSIIIATILMLAVGAISSISLSSHNKVRNESELFGDLAYTFKTFQKITREAGNSQAGPCTTPPCGAWASKQLIVSNNAGTSNDAFGLFDNTTDATKRELIRVSYTTATFPTDSTVQSTKEVLTSFHRTNDTVSFDYNFQFAFGPPNCAILNSVPLGATTVAVCLNGTKSKIPFEIASEIKRRVQ